METFSSLLAICAGNSPGTGEFPTQRPLTRSFDVFFDLHNRQAGDLRRYCAHYDVTIMSYINQGVTITDYDMLCNDVQHEFEILQYKM